MHTLSLPKGCNIWQRIQNHENHSVHLLHHLPGTVWCGLGQTYIASSNEELILNKLLTFKQGDDNGDILEQDDNEKGGAGIVLEQDGGDSRISLKGKVGEGGARTQEGGDNGETVVIQNPAGKLLKKANQKVVLSKLQDLEASAQSEAEAQFLHHIFHLLHHLFHHHHHHHGQHQHHQHRQHHRCMKIVQKWKPCRWMRLEY